ncbi:MAG TPA: ChrR family anti-sigma-E factor, partial [Dongiaceae bacterium]|nr:ChrR family anti-sigma-E factor [Dongiaceae bacterium]
AAVAAAHTAMCARCRREVAMLERIGEALMSELAPAPLERGEPPTRTAAAMQHGRHRKPDGEDGGLPWPVARLVTGGLDAVEWRWLGPGVRDRRLPLAGAGTLRLLRVAPRRNVPEHGHGGTELTLVLRGSFYDETGRYCRGDVSELDESVAHQPVTDSEGDCICLVASERPEQFRGLIARQWQRLRRP